MLLVPIEIQCIFKEFVMGSDHFLWKRRRIKPEGFEINLFEVSNLMICSIFQTVI